MTHLGRGAASFLRETVTRVRQAGATGPLTMRADSGFYSHGLVKACQELDVRFSITVCQSASLRRQLEALPEETWTASDYGPEGTAAVAELDFTACPQKPEPIPVRLIVRRVKPTPGFQLALFTEYRDHPFISDRDGDSLALEADHRRHAEVENHIRDLKYGMKLNHLPSGRFAANAVWLSIQVLAGLRLTTKTLRNRFFALPGRLTSKARRQTLHYPRDWPWANQFLRAWDRLRDKGKPKKVALVAAMRKLLTVLNAIMRDQVPWQRELITKPINT